MKLIQKLGLMLCLPLLLSAMLLANDTSDETHGTRTYASHGKRCKPRRYDGSLPSAEMGAQIANRFKNYSDYLIFEGGNEEIGDRLNDTNICKDSGTLSPDSKTKGLQGSGAAETK